MSDEEADEASAMKYMMGFTDFGTSRRPKKGRLIPLLVIYSLSV